MVADILTYVDLRVKTSCDRCIDTVLLLASNNMIHDVS